MVLKFKAGLGVKVSGIVRLNVIELDQEHFSLYMTPININPDDPAMPISHPSYYASYLSHKIGHYCTLGLAEDTWALTTSGVLVNAASSSTTRVPSMMYSGECRMNAMPVSTGPP